MSIEYDFSGDEEAVRNLIRKFSTDEVLKAINAESNRLFISKTDVRGTEEVEYKVINMTSKEITTAKARIQAWSLLDLAYYSVLFSNDYRGKSVDQEEELYLLSVAVDNLRQRKEENELNTLKNKETDIIFHVWGFAGEQFRFESIHKVFDNLIRDLFIIFESSKHCDVQYDFNRIIKEDTGVEWQEIITGLLTAGSILLYKNSLSEYLKQREAEIKENMDSFRKVVLYYTTTYDDIRESGLERQIFYTKPFISTKKNEIVGLGPFLNLLVCEHCILWILRDHFHKQEKNSQEFVNFFGCCFEEYFREVLSSILLPSEFAHIPEDKNKRADWVVAIDGYRFLIEQKSAIMTLKVKQQNTSSKLYKKYAVDKILEAINQLFCTEADYNDGKYIKIILLYEDYIKPELLDTVFKLPECTSKNDGYCWIMTIDEMEDLLWLYKTDAELFRRVMGEKISRETNYSKEGRSFEQLFRIFNIQSGRYLEDSKFMYYRNVAKGYFKPA